MTFEQLLLLKNQLQNLSFADVTQQISARFDLISDQINRHEQVFDSEQVSKLYVVSSLTLSYRYTNKKLMPR
jgi:hypothetical protein